MASLSVAARHSYALVSAALFSIIFTAAPACTDSPASGDGMYRSDNDEAQEEDDRGDEPTGDGDRDPEQDEDDNEDDPKEPNDDPGPRERDASDDAEDTDDAGPEHRQDAGPPGWEEREDLGEGDGSDVVTIGDSWMSNTLGTGDAIEGALRRLDKRYRNYGVQGVMLLSGSLFGAAIPTQFDAALRADKDIKTVVMTGGGNDIIQTPGLQDDCAKGGTSCKKKLAEIATGLEKLWAKMADAGVEDVIYVGYASDAGSSGEDASNATKNGVAEVCSAAPLHCHIIDSTPLVMGQLAVDGIHPVQAANDRMAKAILALMAERKMRR